MDELDKAWRIAWIIIRFKKNIKTQCGKYDISFLNGSRMRYTCNFISHVYDNQLKIKGGNQIVSLLKAAAWRYYLKDEIVTMINTIRHM
jgi:hypothetical protein